MLFSHVTGYGSLHPRVPDAIQGRGGGRIVRKGHPGHRWGIAGCGGDSRAAGANRAKGASRAVREWRKRGILLCSFSFFVCVKNGHPPSEFV